MIPAKKKKETGTEKKNSKVPIPNTSSAVDDSLSVQPDDPTERRYFQKALLVIGGSFLVMMFFFIAVFFLSVRGAEKTVVPEVRGLELTEALIKLQERELYPRLQIKYTNNPADKGMVLSQDPGPGLYVKAGRRIIVTVSRGAIVDNVEDFVGKTVTEVQGRLASLFSTHEPLLIIREPVSYVYDDSEPGTILAQYPPSGTPLSEPRDLILIASRGKMDTPIRLQDWTDWNVGGTMDSLSRIPLPFLFFEDNVAPAGWVPRVTSQSPKPKTEVGPDARVVLRYSRPEHVAEGSRYGLFDYTLPEYPVPVLLEAFIKEPGKDRTRVFSMPHPGGRITFPFVVPVGTGIILEVNGEEAYRLDILSE